MSMSEQPINLVLASFSCFLDAKEDGVPPAHWLLVPNVPLEAAAYPDVRRYDLRCRAWPFLLHSTVAGQSREGGWRVRNPQLIPVCTCTSSSSRTRGGAAKPHLPSYHMRCADLQKRKAAQMGTMHITDEDAI